MVYTTMAPLLTMETLEMSPPGGRHSRPSVNPFFPEDAALVINSAAVAASGGDQLVHQSQHHSHEQQRGKLIDVPFSGLDDSTATTTATISKEVPNKKKQQRKVVFSDDLVQEQTFESWTVAEKSKVWWTQRDLKQFKIDMKKIMRQLAEGKRRNEDDTEDLCSRGLEIRTRVGSARRLHIKEQAKTAIMRAQFFQQREGFNDPMYLAELYGRYSRQCIQAALTRGAADELGAR